MTTATTVLVPVRCLNPFCTWHDKPMGWLEASKDGFSVTDTRQCWKCKETHRQVIRFG